MTPSQEAYATASKALMDYAQLSIKSFAGQIDRLDLSEPDQKSNHRFTRQYGHAAVVLKNGFRMELQITIPEHLAAPDPAPEQESETEAA